VHPKSAGKSDVEGRPNAGTRLPIEKGKGVEVRREWYNRGVMLVP